MDPTEESAGDPVVKTGKPCSDGDKKAEYLGFKRPRTPNTQYTVLTDEQIMNIKKDASPLFMVQGGQLSPNEMVNGPPREGGRYYKDRFVNSFSQHYLRGEPLSNPFCYVDNKWTRNVDGQHANCRIAAHPRWGPNRVKIPGSRTLRHLAAEDKNDYLTIDCYRRPPTNQPGEIIFKYGRPTEGYYSEKNPTTETWFGSSHILNKQHVVPTTNMFTKAEYENIDSSVQKQILARSGMWPEWSEYTDKFALHSKTGQGDPEGSGMESKQKGITQVSC